MCLKVFGVWQIIREMAFKGCGRKRSRCNGDNIRYLKESMVKTYENRQSGWRMPQRSCNFFFRNEFGCGLRSSGALPSLYLLMFNDVSEQSISPIFIRQAGFNYSEADAWNPTKFTWVLVQTGENPISVRTPINVKWWIQSCWTRNFIWMFIYYNKRPSINTTISWDSDIIQYIWLHVSAYLILSRKM